MERRLHLQDFTCFILHLLCLKPKKRTLLGDIADADRAPPAQVINSGDYLDPVDTPAVAALLHVIAVDERAFAETWVACLSCVHVLREQSAHLSPFNAAVMLFLIQEMFIYCMLCSVYILCLSKG